MKKLLFVINTLGTGGAEVALFELLRRIDKSQYDVSLFVLFNQGELLERLPKGVRLLNKGFDETPIHTAEGQRRLKKKVIASFFKKLTGFKLLGYLWSNYRDMRKAGSVKVDKLFWRLIADSAPRFDERFDMAIAYIEGGSTYYVKDYVKADVKKAFVHIDYSLAGYTRKLDRDCYTAFDNIYAVSDTVKESLIKTYPEVADRTEIFENLIDSDMIEQKSLEAGGFDDDFDGLRILSMGRLNAQKSFEISVDAMEEVVKKGINAKWYVLGEGDQRQMLEGKIAEKGLGDKFLLLGNKQNPFPYLRQCDLYVHASRFEGKSLAIREAMILKCPVIVTDCGGNRELIDDGVNGLICEIDPIDLSNKIVTMLSDLEKARVMGEKAREAVMKVIQNPDGIERLTGKA